MQGSFEEVSPRSSRTSGVYNPLLTLTSGRQGDVCWFLNGKLNASTCCIDQHLGTKADQVGNAAIPPHAFVPVRSVT